MLQHKGKGMVPGVEGAITSEDLAGAVERVMNLMRQIAEGGEQTVVPQLITVRTAAIFAYAFEHTLRRGAKWERVVLAMQNGAPADFAVFAAEMEMPPDLIEAMGKVFKSDSAESLADSLSKMMADEVNKTGDLDGNEWADQLRGMGLL